MKEYKFLPLARKGSLQGNISQFRQILPAECSPPPACTPSSLAGWHGPPCPLILTITVSLAKYVLHKWHNLSFDISLRRHFTPRPGVSPSSALCCTSNLHVCPFLKCQPDMPLHYLLSLPIMPLGGGGMISVTIC